ncbi:MAG: glycogen/starch/alpha-glucan phosphorylase [Colwellia sp.]
MHIAQNNKYTTSYRNETLALELAYFHNIFSFFGAHIIDKYVYKIRVYLPSTVAMHLVTTKGSTAFTAIQVVPCSFYKSVIDVITSPSAPWLTAYNFASYIATLHKVDQAYKDQNH